MAIEPSFRGLRVVSLESRRAAEMGTLIRRYQGQSFVAPSVSERPLDSNQDLLDQTAKLVAGEFDLVILMTATGLAYWRDASVPSYPVEMFAEALGRTALISRGPKPVVILRELGLKPTVIIPEPNTWQEIVPVVAARAERRVAVQEYGRANPELVAALKALGAEVTAICAYKWDLPEDLAPLREAARRIAKAQCDVVIFTTSVQLVHLLAVARAEGCEEEVRHALATQIAIASVGPIMDAALEAEGLFPDIRPLHPKMAPLVRSAATEGMAALTHKRNRLSGS